MANFMGLSEQAFIDAIEAWLVGRFRRISIE
jgi:hypothetical protein